MKSLCHLGYVPKCEVSHSFGGFCVRVWCLWLISGLLEFDQVCVSSWSFLCQLVSMKFVSYLGACSKYVTKVGGFWIGLFVCLFVVGFFCGLCPRCEMSEHFGWLVTMSRPQGLSRGHVPHSVKSLGNFGSWSQHMRSVNSWASVFMAWGLWIVLWPVSKGVSSLSCLGSGSQDVNFLIFGDLCPGYEVSVFFGVLCHMMGILSHLGCFQAWRVCSYWQSLSRVWCLWPLFCFQGMGSI